MGQSIGAVLALAVGVALSPLPIIAVILMLCSTHARVNGTMFLLGWVSGLTIVTTAACLLGSAADVAVGDDTAETARSGGGSGSVCSCSRSRRASGERAASPGSSRRCR